MNWKLQWQALVRVLLRHKLQRQTHRHSHRESRQLLFPHFRYSASSRVQNSTLMVYQALDELSAEASSLHRTCTASWQSFQSVLKGFCRVRKAVETLCWVE